MPTALTYARANLLQRALRRLFASGPGSWLFARIGPRLDRPLHRLTRGRATASSLVSGLPVVMLTTTGARSAQPRTVPVLGLPTPEGLAVVASNWGRQRHPAWYHNIRANPTGVVVVNGQRRRFRAAQAEAERRERIWREGLAIYPGFSQYAQRAPARKIAAFILELE
jgi:deazaflavin-dependent oxidoreductase (nitroreductase family)